MNCVQYNLFVAEKYHFLLSSIYAVLQLFFRTQYSLVTVSQQEYQREKGTLSLLNYVVTSTLEM